MKFYPKIEKDKYDTLSNNFLKLRKFVRENKKIIGREKLSYLNDLVSDMATILFLNTDDNPKFQQWRIERLERLEKLTELRENEERSCEE